jgi:hypothetical protein
MNGRVATRVGVVDIASMITVNQSGIITLVMVMATLEHWARNGHHPGLMYNRANGHQCFREEEEEEGPEEFIGGGKLTEDDLAIMSNQEIQEYFTEMCAKRGGARMQRPSLTEPPLLEQRRPRMQRGGGGHGMISTAIPDARTYKIRTDKPGGMIPSQYSFSFFPETYRPSHHGNRSRTAVGVEVPGGLMNAVRRIAGYPGSEFSILPTSFIWWI